MFPVGCFCLYIFEEPFDRSDANNERRSRKRKIIWFNPPFSKNVCTNVAKHFLDLIDKHFHATHKFNKLFNRNNFYVEKVYTGVTALAWISRYANDKTSFNIWKYINSSELSKEVWRIKDKGGEPTMKWRIIKHHVLYNPVAKRCNLCLSEKLYILEYEGTNLLNKRDKLIWKCRHHNKYTLLHHDSRDWRQ